MEISPSSNITEEIFEDFFADKNQTFDSYTQKYQILVQTLKQFDVSIVIKILCGFLANPFYHAKVTRLELLLRLAAIHCSGRKQPKAKDLSKWLNSIFGESVARSEDPIEEVFIYNIYYLNNNYRIFPGSWQSAGFYLQHLLNAFSELNTDTVIATVSSSIEALLKLSDLIAARQNLPRNLMSEDQPGQFIEINSSSLLQSLGNVVEFTEIDLIKNQINIQDLSPFLFDWNKREELNNQSMGISDIERRPIFKIKENTYVVLTTAISLCLRQFIVTTIDQSAHAQRLRLTLRVKEISYILNDLLKGLGLRPLSIDGTEDYFQTTFYHSVWGTFDKGKYAHVIILFEDGVLSSYADVHNPKYTSESSNQNLKSHIEEITSKLESRSDYTGGLTLIVFGGIGRPYNIQIDDIIPPEKWHALAVPLPDLQVLSLDNEASLLRFWKLKEQEELCRKNNVTIINPYGFINFYSYWRLNDYHILLPQAVYPSPTNTIVFIDTSYVGPYKHLQLLQSDIHVIKFDSANSFLVIRKDQNAIFKEYSLLPVYGSLEHVIYKKLYGAIETGKNIWWICIQQDIPSEYHGLAFQIWHALLNWFSKASFLLENQIIDPNPKIYRIFLEFDGIDSWPSVEEIISNTSEAENYLKIEIRNESIIIHVYKEFLVKIKNVKNLAEKALVSEAIEGVQQLTGRQLNSTEVLNGLFPNDDRRFLHLFNVTKYHDHWAENRVKARFVQPEDTNFNLLGLAWLTIDQNPKGVIIAGANNCTSLLNDSAKSVWKKIKIELLQLNFKSLAIKALLNIEALTIEGEPWVRSARAMLALHEDKEDLIKVANDLNAKREKSSSVTRILIEMALCTCPHESGREISTSEFDHLIGLASVLIELGHYSDGIYDDFIKDNIKVTPSGEIEVNLDLFDEILIPRAKSHFQLGFKRAVRQYDRLYENRSEAEQDPEQPIPQVIDKYKSAFYSEYGLTIKDLGEILLKLQNLALETENMILIMSKNDLDSFLTENGVSQDNIENFLSSFVLPIRECWDQESLEKGFKPKDWWPWKFRRRLSLISRPIVPLKVLDGIQYIITPGLLEKSASYIIDGAYQGHFSNDFFVSQEMKEWSGYIKNKLGHEFNQKVANVLTQKGLNVLVEKKITEIGKAKKYKNLGDIDVLAWDDKNQCIYIIECKKLFFAKTIGEITEQLKNFKGQVNIDGSPDLLLKHIRRVEWANQNKQKICEFIGVSPDKTTIKDMVVFSTVTPLNYYKKILAPNRKILSLEDLENLSPNDL